jgi:hypothetical protein
MMRSFLRHLRVLAGEREQLSGSFRRGGMISDPGRILELPGLGACDGSWVGYAGEAQF